MFSPQPAETGSRRASLCSAALLLLLPGPVAFGQIEANAGKAGKLLRAGAYAVDITPEEFPVLVNGGFQARIATKAHDPLHARCLVLDDGTQQVVIVLVDSCVIDRELFDQAKQLAHKATGIPTDRMLMATTHTHSAPAVIGAHNCDADEKYRKFLPGRIAEGVRRARENLAPARIGWGIGQLPQLAQCRRWITRPDKMLLDPFGRRTVRAMMHPGYRNPDYLGPSGPMDPDVSVLAVQSHGGKPIALLANYSIHYVGSGALSADYFGVFAEKIATLIAAKDREPPFVGILSNGTSGDAYIRDYGGEPKEYDMYQVADAVARVAFDVYRTMEFHDWVPLTMCQEELPLKVRMPSEEDLGWANELLAKAQGRPLKNRPEIYAREQLLMSKMPPVRELKLQTLRIGRLGIVGIPCEVFAITGLKIKRRSPLRPTFTISLANGWDGYIPPPEQHALGGYTTWRARASCLEVDAEPKIVATVIKLLGQVAGESKPAAGPTTPPPAYAAAVLASQPTAYWRLEELGGPHAHNAATARNLGTFESRIAYSMPGPRPDDFAGFDPLNAAPFFAGSRLKAKLKELGGTYTVEMWLNNAMPSDARPVTAYLFSRGVDGADGAPGDHLGIGGTHSATGRLFFYNGDGLKQTLPGTTAIVPNTWNHVVLVRDGRQVAVYLNGNTTPEISGEAEAGVPAGTRQIFLGGRNDNFANFEGKLDEVAIYNRALPAKEIARHYQAARGGR